MCQAVLSPNLTKIFQWEVSQIADNRFPVMMLLGGVNLNHLKSVDDIMLGSLAIHKQPAKTRTLMCWFPENIKELFEEQAKTQRTATRKSRNSYFDGLNQRQQWRITSR